MSSDGEDRRPIARSREGRRRWASRRDLRSPSHSGRRTPSRSPPRSGRRRRTPSRSPTPRQNVLHDRTEEDRDRRNPGRRALTIGRSRSPSRRRALRISRSRSRSRSPRRARRSCRSRSRTRSEECEDSTCCRTRSEERQLPGPERDRGYTSEEEEKKKTISCASPATTAVSSRARSATTCSRLPSTRCCVDGHVICGPCHAAENERRAGDDEEDEEREPSCRVCGSTSYGRSRAAEDLLHGIRFACRNYDYGCPAFRPRHAVAAHERSCRYAPCFCPAAGRRSCGFPGGPPDALERHLTAHHGWAAVGFRYGQPFRVRLHQTRSVLRADDDGALFHLCAAWDRGATAMSMVWIRPDNDAAAAAEFTYEVKTPRVEGRPHRMQMQAAVLGYVDEVREGGR
ncbi:hypothetical protein EJB05_31821, partial [Eragrostis curvula]